MSDEEQRGLMPMVDDDEPLPKSWRDMSTHQLWKQLKKQRRLLRREREHVAKQGHYIEELKAVPSIKFTLAHQTATQGSRARVRIDGEDAAWGSGLNALDESPAWAFHDFNCPWTSTYKEWVSRAVAPGDLLVLNWEDGYSLAVVTKLEGEHVHWAVLAMGYVHGEHEDREIPTHVRLYVGDGAVAAEHDAATGKNVQGECWWRPKGSPPGTPSIY